MISEIKLTCKTKKILADIYTPINLVLKLRDDYNQIALLESNDFRSKEDCLSFIGIDIISEIQAKDKLIHIKDTNAKQSIFNFESKDQFIGLINEYLLSLKFNNDNHPYNGLMGHTNFDGVQYFENIGFNKQKPKHDIPDIRYALYRFIICFDHFKDEMTIIENIPSGEKSRMDQLEILINQPTPSPYNFELSSEATSNMVDEEFKELVVKGKEHCKRGDVFQVVFSRSYQRSFIGDDLNVYRALRSLNPSPYLFYFDYGAYRLFGSSPESQIKVEDNVATLNPIAGTFKREGDKQDDAKKAISLFNDPKENSEHIMLVDLARNDLSINCDKVWIDHLKEIQFFSHVIHLVSKVKGKLKPQTTAYKVYADSFPAGTLSGAPKYKAMEIIDKNEPTARSFYGGSIGIIQLNGDIIHAILIRSFLSKNSVLHFQAGAGIVIDSEEEKELQEINNKLGALNQALVNAEKLY